jgi:RNA polymerase sigma factor (sigma-70 family)
VGGASIEAIEEVYRGQYRRFLRVALAIGGDPSRADDAVQEAFARAIRRRASFRGEGSLESWLWRTLVNVCRDAHRESVRRAEAPADLVHEDVDPERWPELRSAVAALPERQRLVLFLRHYADLDYESIAEALGVRRGTVAATLNAAHSSLRESMAEVKR